MKWGSTYLLAIALACVFTPKNPAFADLATIFVTDFSGSTRVTVGGETKNRLTKAAIESFSRTAVDRGNTLPVGLIAFGNQSKKCSSNFETLITPSNPFNQDQADLLTQELDSLKAIGKNPVVPAMRHAAKEAADLISEENEIDAVRLILFTDLNETCDDQDTVNKSPEFCNVFAEIDENIKDASLVKHSIHLAKIVALAPDRAQFNKLEDCVGERIRSVDSLDDAIQVGSILAENTFENTVLVTFMPKFGGEKDALGRPTPVPTGKIKLYQSFFAETEISNKAVDWRFSAELFWGQKVIYRFQHQFGPDVVGEALFLADEKIDIEWQLPKVRFKLLESKNNSVTEPVRWIVESIGDGRIVELADNSSVVELRLIPGKYVVSAEVWDKPIARHKIEVQADISSDSYTFEFNTPNDILESENTIFNWSVHPPSIIFLGGIEVVVQMIANGVSLSIPRGTNSRKLDPGIYEVTVSANGFQFYSKTFVFAEIEPLKSISVSITPPRISASSETDGVWSLQMINGDEKFEKEIAGKILDQYVVPGKYILFFEGKSVCPDDSAFEVTVGKDAEFGLWQTLDRKFLSDRCEV